MLHHFKLVCVKIFFLDIILFSVLLFSSHFPNLSRYSIILPSFPVFPTAFATFPVLTKSLASDLLRIITKSLLTRAVKVVSNATVHLFFSFSTFYLSFTNVQSILYWDLWGNMMLNTLRPMYTLQNSNKKTTLNCFKCMHRDVCLCRMLQVKICFKNLHGSRSTVEKHFDSVVVNGVCELQCVLISWNCHHLQNLSAKNTRFDSGFNDCKSVCMKMHDASIIQLNTHTMWHGSFLSFRQCPASHFFFVGNLVLIYWEPACVFFMPHHGASTKNTKQ